MLQQTFPKKVTIRIIIYLSDEPGSRSKLRHATDCISGRATGSQMSFHTAKFFIDFQQLIFIYKRHTALGQVHFS